MSSRCPDGVRRRSRVAVLASLVLAAGALAGCEREARRFEPAAVEQVMSDRYESNANALAAGKRLWTWYNCNGCHANGGGASGPALMDNEWVYGSDAATIYRSIAQGRPGGMPAFGDRMPQDQVWQLTAYVRSLAAIAPQDAAPNRDDAFLTRTPESFMDKQTGKPVVEKPQWRPQ